MIERWLADRRGRLRTARFAVVLAGVYVLFAAIYLSINAFSVGRAAHTLFLPGEERIPFLPIFEYLYVLTYFVPVVIVVTVRDYPAFRRLMAAFALTLLAACATYLLFPVYFERPHLEVSSLHTWLLSLSYLDKPYNHFPSLHVALSWLAVFASQVSRPARTALTIVAIGISVSTIFVKQHYIADVVYGFALAWLTWRISEALAAAVLPAPPPTRPFTGDARLLTGTYKGIGRGREMVLAVTQTPEGIAVAIDGAAAVPLTWVDRWTFRQGSGLLMFRRNGDSGPATELRFDRGGGHFILTRQ